MTDSESLLPLAFRERYAAFLKGMEKRGNNPQSRLAALDARIEKGEAKIASAPEGVDLDPAFRKLAELAEERENIVILWTAPHTAYAHLAAALLAAQEMPIKDRGYIEFNLPGVLRARVELDSEPPF